MNFLRHLKNWPFSIRSALPDSFRMNNDESPEKVPDGDDDPLKRREVCSKTPEI
jgi:hypothetical protein